MLGLAGGRCKVCMRGVDGFGKQLQIATLLADTSGPGYPKVPMVTGQVFLCVLEERCGQSEAGCHVSRIAVG